MRWESRSHEKFKRGGRAHKTLQIPSLHMQLNERKRVREMEREARMGGRKDKLHIIGRRGAEDFALPPKNVGFHKRQCKSSGQDI